MICVVYLEHWNVSIMDICRQAGVNLEIVYSAAFVSTVEQEVLLE